MLAYAAARRALQKQNRSRLKGRASVTGHKRSNTRYRMLRRRYNRFRKKLINLLNRAAQLSGSLLYSRAAKNDVLTCMYARFPLLGRARPRRDLHRRAVYFAALRDL
jgi:hypothetical protein